MLPLLVVLLAAYAVSAVLSGVWWDIPATELLMLGASYGPAVADGESWRLVSAIFLHGGLPHLLFNGFALLEIGRPIERQIGWPAALGVFILAGACGFFASLLWHPEGVSVGASGGIFGLLGVWAALAWRHRPAVLEGGAVVRTPSRRGVVVIAVVLAIGSGFLIANVDHAAHLGGLLAGLLSGVAAWHLKRHSSIFFASFALLGGLLLVTPGTLPESLRVERREIREYTERYRLFAEEDRAISLRLQRIGEASRRQEISDQQGLQLIDREILPRLSAQLKQLREQQWQTTRIASDAAQWTQYATLRLQAVQALREAVATDDPQVAKTELARFERLMKEAAQLARPDHPARDKASPTPETGAPAGSGNAVKAPR